MVINNKFLKMIMIMKTVEAQGYSKEKAQEECSKFINNYKKNNP